MEYKLNVYTIWEYGQRTDADGNPHQEDWTFPLPGHTTDADRLFILCDGMGGHDAGEIASATVCEAMSRSILRAQPDPEGPFSDEMLQKALSDAFLALDAKDTGAEKKMGTTLTLLKLHAGGGTIAHMGDSRVYHIRPGKTAADTRILFQTKDHSLINDLIAVGELTEEEAKYSNQKNVITRAMQPHAERRPKADIYHTADIKPGDYFYLCSDGMLENMENPQICYNFSATAGTAEEKVERLTKATQENRDNHTAILVHILEVVRPLEEKKPAPVKAAVAPVPLMAEIHDEATEASVESDTGRAGVLDSASASVSGSTSALTSVSASVSSSVLSSASASALASGETTNRKADAPEGEKGKARVSPLPRNPEARETKPVKRNKYRGVIALLIVLLIALALAICFLPLKGKPEERGPGKRNTNPPFQKEESRGNSEHNRMAWGENSAQMPSAGKLWQGLGSTRL